jgi:glyoxylase-like metal-dependent hydrolase (beta-lactamase superfamily II)
MTYHGTNTWLIEQPRGVIVVDPGPEDSAHLAAVLAAARPHRIQTILVTHAHRDHIGGLAALRAASGAPVAAFAADGAAPVHPEIALRDGETIGAAGAIVALHTPGHAPDHLCFAARAGDGAPVLFSGDHVMSWSTSVVSPPEGDMARYVRALSRLLERSDALYLPGHGPPLPEPQSFVRALLARRSSRERAIAEALSGISQPVAALVDRLYADLDPALRRAAERTLLAHLLKLEQEGRATRSDEGWSERA